MYQPLGPHQPSEEEFLYTWDEHVQVLPTKAFIELGNDLSIRSNNDYRELGSRLGFSNKEMVRMAMEVGNLDGGPGYHLLQRWAEKPDSRLSVLKNEFDDMGRFDLLRKLFDFMTNEHRLTVVLYHVKHSLREQLDSLYPTVRGRITLEKLLKEPLQQRGYEVNDFQPEYHQQRHSVPWWERPAFKHQGQQLSLFYQGHCAVQNSLPSYQTERLCESFSTASITAHRDSGCGECHPKQFLDEDAETLHRGVSVVDDSISDTFGPDRPRQRNRSTTYMQPALNPPEQVSNKEKKSTSWPSRDVSEATTSGFCSQCSQLSANSRHSSDKPRCSSLNRDTKHVANSTPVERFLLQGDSQGHAVSPIIQEHTSGCLHPEDSHSDKLIEDEYEEIPYLSMVCEDDSLPGWAPDGLDNADKVREYMKDYLDRDGSYIIRKSFNGSLRRGHGIALSVVHDEEVFHFPLAQKTKNKQTVYFVKTGSFKAHSFSDLVSHYCAEHLPRRDGLRITLTDPVQDTTC